MFYLKSEKEHGSNTDESENQLNYITLLPAELDSIAFTPFNDDSKQQSLPPLSIAGDINWDDTSSALPNNNELFTEYGHLLTNKSMPVVSISAKKEGELLSNVLLDQQNESCVQNEASDNIVKGIAGTSTNLKLNGKQIIFAPQIVPATGSGTSGITEHRKITVENGLPMYVSIGDGNIVQPIVTLQNEAEELSRKETNNKPEVYILALSVEGQEEGKQSAIDANDDKQSESNNVPEAGNTTCGLIKEINEDSPTGPTACSTPFPIHDMPDTLNDTIVAGHVGKYPVFDSTALIDSTSTRKVNNTSDGKHLTEGKEEIEKRDAAVSTEIDPGIGISTNNCTSARPKNVIAAAIEKKTSLKLPVASGQQKCKQSLDFSDDSPAQVAQCKKTNTIHLQTTPAQVTVNGTEKKYPLDPDETPHNNTYCKEWVSNNGCDAKHSFGSEEYPDQGETSFNSSSSTHISDFNITSVSCNQCNAPEFKENKVPFINQDWFHYKEVSLRMAEKKRKMIKKCMYYKLIFCLYLLFLK